MEVFITDGIYSAHMKPTGTNYGLTRIYVDTRAAGAMGDGSASKPYRTVEQALRLCPEILAVDHDSLMDLRIIMLAGIFDNVLIDRPVALQGVSALFDVQITAFYTYLNSLLLKNSILSNPTGIITAVNTYFEGTLAISTPSISLMECTIRDGITLDPLVTGIMNLNNCEVSPAFNIPASWSITATNSYLADASGAGSLTLHNSTNGHQS